MNADRQLRNTQWRLSPQAAALISKERKKEIRVEREREETKLPHSPAGGDLDEAKDGGVRENEVSGGGGGGVEVGSGSWPVWCEEENENEGGVEREGRRWMRSCGNFKN